MCPVKFPFFAGGWGHPPVALVTGWRHHRPELPGGAKIRNTPLWKVLLAVFVLIFHSQKGLYAQDDLNVISKWIRFSDAPNSLYHYLADQAYDYLGRREVAISQLKTFGDWQNRQLWVRQELDSIFGPFPEKTALNPQITRVIKKAGFTVENIVFESQPGFYVTSSLFIPGGLKKGEHAPAIIYCSGHTDEGYRNAVYQRVILNFVKKGFIVFAFDPIGQGERKQYDHIREGFQAIAEPDKGHSYAGAQLFISGSSLAKYMIWDGIRAIDYLTTRKEVDASRIGITGRSGGGTQTTYIAAMDSRIVAAAPENYITTFKRLIQSSGPQCAEQDPFHFISRGLDIPDLLIARAPLPTLIVATTRDPIFSIQGAREATEESAGAYRAYDRGENLLFKSDDALHESTVSNREAVYAFFQKFLDNPVDSTDLEITPLSDEDLRVTSTGQVSTSFNSETVYSLNKAQSAVLHKTSPEKTLQNRDGVISAAKSLSGFHPPLVHDVPVFTGRFQNDGYSVEKYFLRGEGGYVIPYLLMKPDVPATKVILYLHPLGKVADSASRSEMLWMVRNGFAVLAPDLIGTGETGPGIFRGDSYIHGVSYNTWFLSMLIGRSIAGIQSGDVVKLVDLLKNQEKFTEIYAVAKGTMVPVLLHAAAFDTSISRVALVGPYTSYSSVVNEHFYNPDFIPAAVPGALGSYDLPDLACTLSPRRLLIAGAADGAGTFSYQESDSSLPMIVLAFQHEDSAGQLRVIPDSDRSCLIKAYRWWIK